MKNISLFVVVLVGAFLFSPGSSLSAEAPGDAEGLLQQLNSLSPAERDKRLIEGAKKEGSLLWYAHWDLDELNKLKAGFEKKYPFVKVNTLRMAGGRGLDRILTEARAGRYLADLYYDGPREAYVFYAKEKMAARNLTPHRRELYESQRDTEGYWVSLSLTLNTIAYNSELVSGAEAPKNWDDLLHPRWRGKIAMDTEPDVMIEGLISVWGMQKTEEYLKKLARQNILLRRGHTLITQLLAAGDFPVAAELYDYRVLELKRRGAPLELVLQSPMPAATNALMIPRQASRPHAAALLYDFLVSEEGQRIISLEIGRTPSRKGVPSLYRELDGVADRYQVAVNHPDLVGPHGDSVTKLIEEIFLSQRFRQKELQDKLKKYERK
ncbi:MAG: hypothetical protein A3F90_14790 [Deltaproteobacteria bacterium RIFCSPLOWO2_12_FULL_60_19]|nr:MAG: hypothetical protein A3F90_14790 [Deltaproteobacteria bacterium RIFCSPLOWO2_12_FULL_60_19]